MRSATTGIVATFLLFSSHTLGHTQVLPSLFNDCLRDALLVQGGVEKGFLEGTDLPTVQTTCLGDPARLLYDAVQAMAEQEEHIDEKDERRITRFFGGTPSRGAGSSQCFRTVETANKKPVDWYQCTLILDLGPRMVSAFR